LVNQTFREVKTWIRENLILPFIIFMVYPVMIGMPLKGILVFNDKKVLSYALIVNFFFIPLVGYLIISLFFKNT